MRINQIRWLTVLLVLSIMACVLFITKTWPVAMVGTKLVTFNGWQQYWQMAKKLDVNANRETVFDQFILARQKQILVDTISIAYTSANFDEELRFYTLAKEQEYNQLLSDYFSGSDQLFLQHVVVPLTYDAMLRIKYNSDFTINSVEYNQATSILSKIQSGEKFEDLARAESDDKVTGQLGGDLGFVTQGQLLPELEKVVMNSNLGQVVDQIIISRYGYHIIYPVETGEDDGQKVWHVKHILIKTHGYEVWLDANLDKIRVWRMMI